MLKEKAMEMEKFEFCWYEFLKQLKLKEKHKNKIKKLLKPQNRKKNYWKFNLNINRIC